MTVLNYHFNGILYISGVLEWTMLWVSHLNDMLCMYQITLSTTLTTMLNFKRGTHLVAHLNGPSPSS